jgi:hypothetical protein
MQLKLEVLADDNEIALQQTQNLKKWLENEEALTEVFVKLEHSQIQKGDAGGDLLSVLQIVLSSSLLAEFAKLIQSWSQERSKRLLSKSNKLKLVITKPDGTKIEIDADNLGESEKALIESLK